MTVRVEFAGEWPEWVAPLLDALDRDPPPDLTLQPDAAIVPPVTDGVGFLTDTRRLAFAEHRDTLLAALEPWRHGQALLVPTATAAATLAAALPPLPVLAASLPLPWARRIPVARHDPNGPIVLVEPVDYGLAFEALAALRLAGVQRRILVTGPTATSAAAPGGLAGRWLFDSGHEVAAVPDWRDALDGASLLVVTDGTDGLGAVLREVLASGLPVVAVEGPYVLDHLAAAGARCGLARPAPVPLAAAIAGALNGGRGLALAGAARRAVQTESWSVAADAVRAATTPPEVRPRRAARDRRLVVANLHASGGGGERFVRELVPALRGLIDPAVGVTLVAADAGGAAFALGTAELEEAGIDVVTAPASELPDALGAAAEDATLVHIAWPHLAEVPAVAGPLVCTFHDANWRHFHTYSREQAEAADRQSVEWVERADRFICSSQFIRGELTRFFRADPARIDVVPLTADRDSEPVSDVEREAMRERYALPDTFVLSPHGNHLHKNYAVLRAALDRLRAEGRPATVVATGAGTTAFHGPDMIGLGYVSRRELTVLYDLASGMVQTTLYEAGSFPMWEAMLAGIPVACSAIPPLVEQLERQGTTALTFDPADRDAVADAVASLTAEPFTDEVLADNARRVAERTFADVAAGYLGVFESVAKVSLQ